MSHVMRKPTMWFPNRSNTNRAVQVEKMAGNFGFSKSRNCTIHLVKTKVLISFAVTAKLFCPFIFAYAKCWFSHDTAQQFSTLIRLRICVITQLKYEKTQLITIW